MDNKKLIAFLKEFVLEERYNTFIKVLNNRTDYITIVLEDLFQSHNASAVIRSCDCFGIQDVHFIENDYQFEINPEIAVGSAQWLNLYKYNKKENNTLQTINILKDKGYRIIATTPHKDDVTIETLDLEKGKIALLFGSELPGLSEIAMKNADEFVKIKMFGFTESFNISVSAALCLYELTKKLHNSSLNWQLYEQQKDEILAKWLKISIKNSEQIIKLKFNG